MVNGHFIYHHFVYWTMYHFQYSLAKSEIIMIEMSLQLLKVAWNKKGNLRVCQQQNHVFTSTIISVIDILSAAFLSIVQNFLAKSDIIMFYISGAVWSGMEQKRKFRGCQWQQHIFTSTIISLTNISSFGIISIGQCSCWNWHYYDLDVCHFQKRSGAKKENLVPVMKCSMFLCQQSFGQWTFHLPPFALLANISFQILSC